MTPGGQRGGGDTNDIVHIFGLPAGALSLWVPRTREGVKSCFSVPQFARS